METILQRQISESFSNAIKAESKGLVGSSLHTKGFNKNYPFGVNIAIKQRLFDEEQTIKPKGATKIVVLSRAKEENISAIKKAKSEIVNKGKLTTIYSNKI